jgi:hypothetical protein
MIGGGHRPADQKQEVKSEKEKSKKDRQKRDQEPAQKRA